MNYDRTIIAGNVGKDSEMHYTPPGKAVTSFSVAVNDHYTNTQGEKVKRTRWYRIQAWGRMAEVCNQYVKKGMQVLVEGRLIGDPNTGGPRVWTKKDGSTGASFELNASTVQFGASSQHTGNAEGGMVEAASELPGEEYVDYPPQDDIPF